MYASGRTTTDSRGERQLWRKVLEAEEKEHFAVALEYAKKYTSTYPDNVWGWALWGRLLGGFTRYAEARKAFAHALRIAPLETRKDLSCTIGLFYKDKGDLKRARIWLQRYLEARPGTRAWVFLGTVLAQLGDHAEAKQCHRNAITAGTECADEAYYNLGLLLRSDGDYEDAMECFTKAIELDPQYRLAKLAKRDAAAALRVRNEQGMRRILLNS